jgi:hypothetical protein
VVQYLQFSRKERCHEYYRHRAGHLDDWSHEGPDDPEGDEIIAREALAQLDEIKKNPSQLRSWEEFEAELARAEAAGELPD